MSTLVYWSNRDGTGVGEVVADEGGWTTVLPIDGSDARALNPALTSIVPATAYRFELDLTALGPDGDVLPETVRAAREAAVAAFEAAVRERGLVVAHVGGGVRREER